MDTLRTSAWQMIATAVQSAERLPWPIPHLQLLARQTSLPRSVPTLSLTLASPTSSHLVPLKSSCSAHTS